MNDENERNDENGRNNETENRSERARLDLDFNEVEELLARLFGY